MINYIIRRLIMVPVILFGVTLLIFGMLQFLSPVERSALYVRDVPRNEKVLEGVIKTYGLDKPIYVQYWKWLVGIKDPATGEIRGGILRGDFGYSRTASQPVADLIKRRFPATVELSLWSVIPVVAGGIILGVIAAVNHNKPVDHITRVFAIVGWSFPDFVLGLLLLMLFYANLGWFPPGRISDWANRVLISPEFRNFTGLITIDALLNLRLDVFWDALKHLVLPVITLAYLWWALQMRVTRSSMLETMRQDYIVTARSKGVAERNVINKHALPNALMPVVTLGGATVVGLLGGVVIVETVYNFPGIGSAYAAAAVTLDVISVLAFTLLNSLIMVVAYVIVDIMYAYIDPRVRLD
ncbi:MAG: ABC transporter permease [Anaerolineales bacterium]|nr:ABC transporter permease [Anaerolineales bacterium]